MKQLFAGLALLAVAAGAESSTLNIPPGETFVVDEDSRTLSLEQLTIGDDATVRFAEGVDAWNVSAQRAVIGEGVVIDGRGGKGADGAPGPSWSEAAATCQDGKDGGDGTVGKPGGDGVDIDMALGVASLGSLRIIADGGPGGDGGAGGRGQRGGGIDRCHGGNGGDGGAGGAGGSGGDGGDVNISYWAAGDIQLNAIKRRIDASSAGGALGSGGAGGAPGEGAEGQYQKGSVMGKKRWLAGGDPGEKGATGPSGKPGERGEVQIAENLKKTLGAVPRSAATGDLAGEVKQLRQRIDELERRVRSLEQRRKP